METSDAKHNHRTVRLGFFAFLTVFVYAGAVALVPRTLITPWVPFCAAGMVAAATGAGMWRLWRRITAREKPFWNYLCHTVMMTGMLAAVFYISNYALADDSTYHKEETVLVRKYRETRHHSKRLSRARYVRGDPLLCVLHGSKILQRPDKRYTDTDGQICSSEKGTEFTVACGKRFLERTGHPDLVEHMARKKRTPTLRNSPQNDVRFAGS